VARGRGDRYTVISREGGQAISTSRAGVDAIRLLAGGHSVDQTRRDLARRYGHPANDVDLTPLLDTLLSSGFVRAVDGRQLAGEQRAPHRGVRFWLTLVVLSRLLDWATKHLPPSVSLRLAYWWFAPVPAGDAERRIVANLRCAPELDRTAEEIRRVARAGRHALRKQFCDRLLLGALPPRRLRRWLGELPVSGLEHLRPPDTGQPGAILCSFHIGSYGLIPFVLGARGVPVTVYSGFGEEARADVTGWVSDRAGGEDAYPVRVTGGTMGLRALARAVKQGEIVLLYADQAPGETRQSQEGRGLVSVPFLGTRIWAPRGIAWLHARTGAPVLPSVLLWEGRSGHHLHIHPDVAQEDPDAVVAAAFHVLDGYVRREPGQWLRWEGFGEMLVQ
jgi:lauroyl/myristoyl acyltransferase